MSILKRVPEKIATKLGTEGIDSDSIVVACALRVSPSDLSEGKFLSLGITFTNGSLQIPSDAIFPSADVGRLSDENINGREIKLKDRPKISKDIYCGERPNYGDWSNGSFSLWQTRDVYQRSLVQPHGFSIKIVNQGRIEESGQWKLTFTVQPSLLRTDPSFDADLLFALSLLRENTGVFDVFPSNVTPSDIIGARRIAWDIFPPGRRDFRRELERRLSSSDVMTRDRILARADVIEGLEPVQYVLGAGLNSNYYGALFADDLVVFENLDYGNATYVLYRNWEQLSQLSRTDLLRGDAEYDRLIHGNSWQNGICQ